MGVQRALATHFEYQLNTWSQSKFFFEWIELSKLSNEKKIIFTLSKSCYLCISLVLYIENVNVCVCFFCRLWWACVFFFSAEFVFFQHRILHIAPCELVISWSYRNERISNGLFPFRKCNIEMRFDSIPLSSKYHHCCVLMIRFFFGVCGSFHFIDTWLKMTKVNLQRRFGI